MRQITLAALAAMGLSSGAFATTMTLNGTGFDAAGNPLTSTATSGGVDGSWTVSGAPSVDPTGQAFFIAPGNVNFFTSPPPAYAPNTNTATFSGSGWVSNNATSTFNGPAPYTFSMNFSLSGINLSEVSIAGMWSIADGGVLELNGNVVDTLSVSTSPWGTLHPFSVTNSAFLNQGNNIFTMTVTNADQVFEAARFEGTVTISPITAAPEPSALSLLGLAVLAIGLLRHRWRT